MTALWFCVALWAAAEPVALVRDGQAVGVVIVPAEPSPVVRYAAAELIEHIRRRTGVALPLAGEGALDQRPAVLLGPTGATAAAGLVTVGLPPDGCRLRTVGQRLHILGRDGAGEPLSPSTEAGTLMGVYDLLARELGVRWLWPGELGTVVPEAPELILPPVDRVWEPWLVQRRVRDGLVPPPDSGRGFTPADRAAYRREQAVYLRRHRLGAPVRLRYGHAFPDWWDRYGAEHPEWFQLLPTGRRGPERPGAETSMCVSEPGLHRQIIDVWRRWRRENPGQFVNINGCENDIRGLCVCDRCRGWDGPQPENLIDPRLGNPVVSDRYARFWLTLQQLAASDDPEATVIGYAYTNYAYPPSPAIRLNERIWVGTVPDLWFPRQPAEQQWVKDQWTGWAATGAKVFLRPNYFLDGWCLPQIYVHQFADEFQFEAARGMIFTDFDSLTGQWATQGPNLYALMRLHTDPRADIDELLGEYYAGFGAAAAAVKAYFDYWERYTQTDLAAVKPAGRWVYRSYPRFAPTFFTEAALARGAELLMAAEQAAREPTERARVAFLQRGLEHARLALRTAVLATTTELQPAGVARRALTALDAYRQAHGSLWLGNLDFLAACEDRSWRLAEGSAGEPVRRLVDRPAALDPALAIPLRGRADLVTVLDPGQPFTARLTSRRVGRYEDKLRWALFDATLNRVGEGDIDPGETVIIDRAVGPGVWTLVVDAGQNVALARLLTGQGALAGRRAKLLGAGPPLYFLVPAGVPMFRLTVKTDAPAETALVELRNPRGEVVAVADTSTGGEQTLTGSGAAGVWSVAWRRAARGILEDVELLLDPALPPFWSLAPDALVTPE